MAFRDLMSSLNDTLEREYDHMHDKMKDMATNEYGISEEEFEKKWDEKYPRGYNGNRRR